MGGNNGGRFMDGLMLGALVGGAAVFLLGTKKGNRVLKVLTEEGLGGIGDILSDFGDGVQEGIKKASKQAEKVAEEEVKDLEEKVFEERPAPKKRFFRKTK